MRNPIYDRQVIWISRDPVTLLSRLNLKRWSEWMYGKSMEFKQESAEDRVTLLVNRCAFHQFLLEQGEPELTQLFCAWDRHGMDVIDESTRPVRIERPHHDFYRSRLLSVSCSRCPEGREAQNRCNSGNGHYESSTIQRRRD